MNQLKAVTVTGGHVAMANLLKDKHGWDGSSVHVTVQHRLGTLGNIENTSWLALGSLKPFTVSATDIWGPADKQLKVTFKAEDLSMFRFQPMRNISQWVRMGEILPVFYTGSRNNKKILSSAEASAMGVGDLACRIHIIPSSTTEAKLWFSVVPISLQDLEEQLPGKSSSNSVPSITFAVYKSQRDEGRGKAAKAFLGVQEDGDSIGIGALALVDNTQVEEGDPALAIGAYKEATVQAYLVCPQQPPRGGQGLRHQVWLHRVRQPNHPRPSEAVLRGVQDTV